MTEFAQELCIRCQTPVVSGQTVCRGCGHPTGATAETGPFLQPFDVPAGFRRDPGAESTFVRLRWLPAATGLVMFVVTLAAVPGRTGAIAAPLIAVVTYALCTLVRDRMAAMAENESPATPVCPHCFAEYEIGDDFCPKCGKPVGDATSTMPFIPPPGEDFEDHGKDEKKKDAADDKEE